MSTPRLTLSQNQRRALKAAMTKDQYQFMVDSLTPTRRYAFPMDFTLPFIESLLNSPKTRAHHVRSSR